MAQKYKKSKIADIPEQVKKFLHYNEYNRKRIITLEAELILSDYAGIEKKLEKVFSEHIEPFYHGKYSLNVAVYNVMTRPLKNIIKYAKTDAIMKGIVVMTPHALVFGYKTAEVNNINYNEIINSQTDFFYMDDQIGSVYTGIKENNVLFIPQKKDKKQPEMKKTVIYHR